MNQECEAVQEALSAHLDGELAGDRLEELHRHLAACPHCQGIVEDYSSVGRLLRQEADRESAVLDFGALREGVLEKLKPSGQHTGARQLKLGVKRSPWRVSALGVWALGFAMAIAVIWLFPLIRQPGDQRQYSSLNSMIQEQLGQAIRDAAGLRYDAFQGAGRYQERLGRLIRNHFHRNVQEELGLLIRDHAHARRAFDQRHGQLQERIGLLIQTKARQQVS